MFQIIEPQTERHWRDYYQLRWEVLRKPWRQPMGSEQDELEATAYHLLAVNQKEEVLAVGRLHIDNLHIAHVRYMAVTENYRGSGIGSKILAALEQYALSREVSLVKINARDSAMAFYSRAGYKVVGKGHTLFGMIAHTCMEKHI